MTPIRTSQFDGNKRPAVMWGGFSPDATRLAAAAALKSGWPRMSIELGLLVGRGCGSSCVQAIGCPGIRAHLAGACHWGWATLVCTSRAPVASRSDKRTTWRKPPLRATGCHVISGRRQFIQHITDIRIPHTQQLPGLRAASAAERARGLPLAPRSGDGSLVA
jgi:hypothetical protein